VETVHKNHFKTVFEPGLQLKARLGIRLIFNKENRGRIPQRKIKVLSSDIGKGTTMQVSLKVV
jgi:hypothetical protein